ncbi:MAG TPA: 2-amino-4-hydroxy-6-hydroxymethyldihydropteridine diphosphokinase [Rhizomicrobium sp.]|jgi:2-amino-4-hydroxy-6-hydroxymethyldihydropteridine diphosphokinase|nr:2-amino-4-hydroxy-6-hydroxymethyldihydropteridine diphosphokinase [Rhizomicrobium sp.]
MIAVALGANLPSRAGSPYDTLLAALDALCDAGAGISAVSPFYRSPAWPDPRDPPFVNAVAVVTTELSPSDLMEALHGIERAFGRTRSAKNAPRTLDLDLVDFNGRVEKGPPILPHPRLRERGFVLVPLADLAPDWRHPVTGETVSELIAALPGGTADISRLVGGTGEGNLPKSGA